MRNAANSLTLWLQIAAAAQLAIAALNLALPRMLGWRENLARLPLLIREVFYVHAWFISITLATFAAMTWRFAGEMADGTNDASRWLATAIGIFWIIRAVLQVTYYSPSHWRGRLDRTSMHIALLAIYGGIAVIYMIASLGRVF